MCLLFKHTDISKVLVSNLFQTPQHIHQTYWYYRYFPITFVCTASVNVLALSLVDRVQDLIGQTKDYEIGTWWFSTKHTVLRTVCLRIRILGLIGETCQPTDYYFGELHMLV